MKYCVRCVMPNTRPGIYFDENGVCQACINAERRKSIDWDSRRQELAELCDRHRGRNGEYYDCIIAVSGGKDSHYQVYVMKEVMKMNPLLVSVDNFSWTEAGRHNIENISEAFGCDMITLTLNRKLGRIMLRKAFEKLGSPTWYWDRAIYTYPIRMAINFKIPLVVYGENVSYEYGGRQEKETYSALQQIHNDVVKPVDWDVWFDDDISMRDFNAVIYPSSEEVDQVELEPIYLSYFLPWESRTNVEIAKRYGFVDLAHEWKREGFIEDYDGIDSLPTLVHSWMKYPKFGHARTTDVASSWIRSGLITRSEGINLVKEHDHKLDQRALRNFLTITGYSAQEFWGIVDTWYNEDLFTKKSERWVLNSPIYDRYSMR